VIIEASSNINMKICLLLCGALLVSASALSFDENAAKNRPVSKVITLLKDMLKQLEKEAAEDDEIYDTMACWYETKNKKNSINR